MATLYWTDFGDEYVLGNIFAQGWVSKFDPVTWEVAEDVSASNGRALRVTGDASRAAATWGAVNADPERADVEVLMRARYSSSSNTLNFSAMARASGTGSTGSSHNMYLGHSRGNDQFEITRYRNGSLSALATDDGYSGFGEYGFIRFRVSGTNPVELKAKYWNGSIEDEPPLWDHEYSDSSASRIEDAGSVGVFRFSNEVQWIDWIGVATGGLSAPSSSVTPANRNTINITATSARATWDAP